MITPADALSPELLTSRAKHRRGHWRIDAARYFDFGDAPRKHASEAGDTDASVVRGLCVETPLALGVRHLHPVRREAERLAMGLRGWLFKETLLSYVSGAVVRTRT